MFTIRHMTETGESLSTCESVDVGIDDVSGFKTVYAHGDGVLSIDTGDVFVMNERGKTVATYRLGDPRSVQSDIKAQMMRTISGAGQSA